LLWAPYLAFLLPFVAWRAFFSPSPRAQIVLVQEILKAPLAALSGMARTIVSDFIEVNFLAWFKSLDLGYLKDFDSSVLTLLGGAVFLSFAFTLIYLLLLKGTSAENLEQPASTSTHWAAQAVGLGLIAFLVSGWTIWITDLHFELLFPFDRFTLISMPGTSLLIAGIVGFLDRRRWIGSLMIALLVGLSVAIQFQHRLVYRQEWLSQKNFFWQLIWRAPGIEPGTTLMTSEIPFTYYSDNSLSAPINWIYAPQNDSREMKYLLYDIEARLGESLPELKPGLPIEMPYRAARFDGSTSDAIVLFYDPPRCLKVMNPAIDRFLPVKPLYIREAAPLSRLELILPGAYPPAALPQHLFGAEPPHTWCYFFEKAELFAQQGDWEGVTEMADQALKINKHFTEKNVSELIPFIMGYAHTGNWKKAVELSSTAYEIWDKTQYPLCDAWQSIRQNTPQSEPKQAALMKIQANLSCTFP
jgi:hypothetical protein